MSSVQCTVSFRSSGCVRRRRGPGEVDVTETGTCLYSDSGCGGDSLRQLSRPPR